MAEAGKTPRTVQTLLYTGLQTFMRVPYRADPTGADVAVVGIPIDIGNYGHRVGSRRAPHAIREMSARVGPYHRQHDLDVFEHLSVVDCGDLPFDPGDIERSYDMIAEALAPWVKASITLVTMGGNHTLAMPTMRVLARTHGRLRVLQFDAHADTRPDSLGHPHSAATIFRRAIDEGLVDPHRSVQVGIRDFLPPADPKTGCSAEGYHVIEADEVFVRGVGPTLEKIRKVLTGDGGKVFLSFDIDGIDPAYAPGVNAPSSGGLTPREAFALLRGLTDVNFVSYELSPINPAYDPVGITSLLGATIMFEFLGLIAARKRAGK